MERDLWCIIPFLTPVNSQQQAKEIWVLMWFSSQWWNSSLHTETKYWDVKGRYVSILYSNLDDQSTFFQFICPPKLIRQKLVVYVLQVIVKSCRHPLLYKPNWFLALKPWAHDSNYFDVLILFCESRWEWSRCEVDVALRGEFQDCCVYVNNQSVYEIHRC